jgi:hypothetical protein
MIRIVAVLLLFVASNLSAEHVRFVTAVPPPSIGRHGELAGDAGPVLDVPGEPRLPHQCYRLLLPHGTKLQAVHVALEDYRELTGQWLVPPAQGPVPISGGYAAVSGNPAVYEADRPYPEKDHEFVHVQRLSGMDIATINVFPYKYHPRSQRLGWFGSVAIDIAVVSDRGVRAEQGRRICTSPRVLRRLEALVENPSMHHTYPDGNTPASGRDLVDPQDPHRFLIITGSAYQTVFEAYAQWKETHDVSAAVFLREDIYAEYTTGDGPARIRAFISDAYDVWAGSEEPLEFVLLGGDDEIIPIRGCWGYTDYFGYDYNIPCDLYYGALDGDWNADGDGVYGEPEDDPDLYPEVHVGRFTGDNATEFQNMMTKIQQYVEDPWPNMYTNLMVGEQLGNDPPYWGGDYLDMICDDPNYLPPYYQVTKLYDILGTFSTQAVWDHMNSDGSAMIFHCGHAHYYYLMGLNQGNIDNMYNTQFPFFSSGGCHTLAFDQGTSGNAEAVGEHCLFDDHAMASYLGHARYGFTNWTNFMMELVAGLFHQNIPEIGASLSYSREQLAYTVDNPIWRWEYYEINLAGDPEMHMVYGPSPLDLTGDLVGGQLVLSWRDTGGTEDYWVYGKAGDAYFVPALLPPYTNRLAVLPYGSTSWSSASGVGDPSTNWTYQVVAVDASNQEVCRSERVGEHDFTTAVGGSVRILRR